MSGHGPPDATKPIIFSAVEDSAPAPEYSIHLNIEKASWSLLIGGQYPIRFDILGEPPNIVIRAIHRALGFRWVRKVKS